MAVRAMRGRRGAPGAVLVPQVKREIHGSGPARRSLLKFVGYQPPAVGGPIPEGGYYLADTGYVTDPEQAADFQGVPGTTTVVTEEQVVMMPGEPGEDGAAGKSAYQRAVELGLTALSETDWLASLKGAPGDPGDPGGPGRAPTEEEIAAATAAYLQTNPPARGRDPTSQEIAAATADYLAAHPPAAGRPPNAQEIGDATAAYLSTHPPADGKSVELRISSGQIQWRRIGDSTWTDLVALSAITGAPGTPGSPGNPGTAGKQVELQATATVIQWRYVGDAAWTNLVAISALKGDPGATGAAGATLMGVVVIGQSAVVAISLGIREVTTALAGVVRGGRYVAFCDSYKLNGGSTVAGRPAGYTMLDCVCNADGQITVSLNAPLLAIGQSYALNCAIVRVNAT